MHTFSYTVPVAPCLNYRMCVQLLSIGKDSYALTFEIGQKCFAAFITVSHGFCLAFLL